MTLEEWKKLLSYDPSTGKFTWLRHFRRGKIGKVAGYFNNGGYTIIRWKNHDYYAHRLAFLFVTGTMPDIVDHANKKNSDNRWVNLREASKSQNNFNSVPRLTCKGLPRGITPCLSKYEARFYANGKVHYLGVFTTVEEAVLARKSAAEKVYGEFA